jgi:hypothetical protein
MSIPPLKHPPKPHTYRKHYTRNHPQTVVLTLNTSTPNTMPLPLHQHQTIETQEDLQQDSEEEIKAIIEDELARLHQENECLRLL